MTEAQTALSRRLVTSAGWRWMPGMRAYFQHERRGVRVTDPACWVSTTALPDVTDAATLGCLLALVREAWGDECAHMMPQSMSGGGGWDFWACPPGDGNCPRGVGQTEAEALVAALEGAP